MNGLGLFNDLWKYEISSNKWCYLSGSDTMDQSGVYGSQGFGASANHPGGRAHMTINIDNYANKMLLFGGNGFDSTGALGISLNSH
jgi:hypothetical protein